MTEYRTPLDTYDKLPEDMINYLRHNGWHFNKKACDYAVGKMRKLNAATGRMEKIEPWTKEEVDKLLTANSVTIENNVGYDYVYLANMVKADFYKSSLPSESSVAQFVKDGIDDADAPDGAWFAKWYACMVRAGEMVEWDELL